MIFDKRLVALRRKEFQHAASCVRVAARKPELLFLDQQNDLVVLLHLNRWRAVIFFLFINFSRAFLPLVPVEERSRTALFTIEERSEADLFTVKTKSATSAIFLNQFKWW